MKINFEKVLAEYGLKIGDKIVIFNEVCEIIKGEDEIYLKGELNQYSISALHYFDFEPINPKKKVGDIICYEIDCIECPFKCVSCKGSSNKTLRAILKTTLKEHPELEPMKGYLEAELEKELEE